MDLHQEELSADLAKTRSQFRRGERNWMLERDTLQRKLQYLQTFGGVPSEALAANAGGFFTDQRAAARQGLGDAQLKQQIQKLNVRP